MEKVAETRLARRDQHRYTVSAAGHLPCKKAGAAVNGQRHVTSVPSTAHCAAGVLVRLRVQGAALPPARSCTSTVTPANWAPPNWGKRLLPRLVILLLMLML
jgi:hypothetical protein